MCIEDNLFPKRCSFYTGVTRDLSSAAEHAGKVRACKDSSVTEEFFVIARTETLIAGGTVAEALDRGLADADADAGADAGADAVLVHSKARGPEQLVEFAEQWNSDVPLVCVPTTYDETSADELHGMGYAIVIFANQGLRSAIRAVQQNLAVLRGTGRAADLRDAMASLEDVFELVDVAGLRAAELPADLNRYTDTAGVPALRSAIAERSFRTTGVQVGEDQVVVTTGAKQALFLAALALFGPGAEVLVPTPAWGTLAAQVNLVGARAVPVDTTVGVSQAHVTRSIARAQALGFEVVLGDSAVVLAARAPLIANVDRQVVVDYTDLADLRQVARVLHAERPLTAITTFKDTGAINTAVVTAELGLIGNSPAAVAACDDKAATRALLARAGIPGPRFAVCSTPAQVHAFADAVGLPVVVVKPRNGQASAGVEPLISPNKFGSWNN